MIEIVVMFIAVFIIWGGSEIVMYYNRQMSRPRYINTVGMDFKTTQTSQAIEDAIENAVKLRHVMTKEGYEYASGNFYEPDEDNKECTGWCMYVRRLDNHVRRFSLEHGIWIEQIVEGTQSELEQIP